MFSIYEIYNNISCSPGVKTDFGYSCYIAEAGVLFDSGARGEILLENLRSMGISPSQIKYFVLSHDHWDHNGGIGALLDENPGITSFYPPGTSDKTVSVLKRGSGCVCVEKRTEIAPGVFSTGPVEGMFSGEKIIEQSLVLDLPGSLFVVAGCSHPHISKILSVVRKWGEVSGVIGGFHDVDSEDVESLKGLKYIAPSHCTDPLETIETAYPREFLRCGAGYVHRV